VVEQERLDCKVVLVVVALVILLVLVEPLMTNFMAMMVVLKGVGVMNLAVAAAQELMVLMVAGQAMVVLV
jgi:hypothetical protein